MCGITGFIDYSKKTDAKTLVKMTRTLAHRGPDDEGVSVWHTEAADVGFGHRRLSVLDPSPLGHQPMHDDNRSIVFNGEIYNFEEIKTGLEGFGLKFRSRCDTEVILKAFGKWGPGCVHRFIGMFSFVLFDRSSDRVFLFRDRAGVKPLYYYYANDICLFSSELKSFFKHPAFYKEIDRESLGLYLLFGYIPAPYSIFKNTWKVLPGHYYEIDLKRKTISQNKYWDVTDCYNEPRLDIGEKEAEEELERILVSAFGYRMVSDVPVGLFLSGGYDSSAVAALLQENRTEKINTFTIGFREEKYDEAPFARKVASFLGTNHTEYYCTQKEALEIIPDLPLYFDEPFGDSSAIPTILVSRVARKNVTVALSADAGDETFAGYDTYLAALRYLSFLKALPGFSRGILSKIMDKIDPERIPGLNATHNFRSRYLKLKHLLASPDSVSALKLTRQVFMTDDLSRILSLHVAGKPTFFESGGSINDLDDDVNRMLAIDYKTYMTDDILVKIDRATMSTGLEGREPLLDHRIIELMARLPSHLKLNAGVTKYILRKIVHRHLTAEIVSRPKKGFSVPIADWLADGLESCCSAYLDPARLKSEGFFIPGEVAGLKHEFLCGKRDNVQKLWLLLMFEMWLEKWM
jgi:asparagine synthase (glutamine-hydrolysing)